MIENTDLTTSGIFPLQDLDVQKKKMAELGKEFAKLHEGTEEELTLLKRVIEVERIVNIMHRKINRILIHLNIDDKKEFMEV